MTTGIEPSTLSRRQQKFIATALRELGFLSYREYLKSDHWRGVKDHYRQTRMPQTCVVCRDPNIDLHHRSYKRLGVERMDDLVPLCRDHHEAAHATADANLWTASSQLKRAASHPRRLAR